MQLPWIDGLIAPGRTPCDHSAIARYFKSRGHQSDLEDEIDLLDQALRTFDFNRLRSQWPALAGHGEVIVTLTHGVANRPTLAFGNIFIVPPAIPL